jgi:hypothetical protein
VLQAGIGERIGESKGGEYWVVERYHLLKDKMLKNVKLKSPRFARKHHLTNLRKPEIGTPNSASSSITAGG